MGATGTSAITSGGPDKAEDAQFPDTEYRTKIMENGMLLFQHKELGANYFYAPHTWRRVRTLGVDPTE